MASVGRSREWRVEETGKYEREEKRDLGCRAAVAGVAAWRPLWKMEKGSEGWGRESGMRNKEFNARGPRS